jgi:hypothetical protein
MRIGLSSNRKQAKQASCLLKAFFFSTMAVVIDSSSLIPVLAMQGEGKGPM